VSDKQDNKPPILEVFCKLEEVSVDEGQGYILIRYDKRNKVALYNVIRELESWIGQDIYMQFRRMLKQ
jgi:hypothetical protein